MMATWGLIALNWLAAGDLTCSRDAQGFCTDRVVRYRLSYDVPEVSLPINVALGISTTVQLPPGVSVIGDLPVGNTVLLDYRLEGNPAAADAPLRLIIWPRIPTGQQRLTSADVMGMITNLELPLDGGITVVLQVKFAPIERAVQRVVVDFPERQAESAYVQKRLQEERQRLVEEMKRERDQLKETVADATERELAQSMLQPVYCENLRDRAESGLLIARASRICRLGDHVFINFSVHNRARDLFSLAGVEVRASGVDANPLDAKFEYRSLDAGAVMLGYDGLVEGVAALHVGPSEVPRAFDVRVLESGGKKREVVLRGVGF